MTVTGYTSANWIAVAVINHAFFSLSEPERLIRGIYKPAIRLSAGAEYLK